MLTSADAPSTRSLRRGTLGAVTTAGRSRARPHPAAGGLALDDVKAGLAHGHRVLEDGRGHEGGTPDVEIEGSARRREDAEPHLCASDVRARRPAHDG